MITEPPDALLANRCDPYGRAVLEDWLGERGRHQRWLALMPAPRNWNADAAAADADAADADAAAADADAAAADAAADAAAAAAADAAADAAAAADDAFSWLKGEIDVKNGLAIVAVPSTYYYPLLRVGWLRRVAGDEWEIVGARTLTRIGDQVRLAKTAAEGIGRHTRLEHPSESPEPVHRLQMARVIYCNVDKWPEMPKPASWVEE